MVAGRGVREVTLLGQNVNSYGQTLPQGPDFAELIRAIGKVPGIARIRFTTSHPKDLSERLMACFGEVPALCEHIHLPVQSGSDRVLERMNRGYTAEEYRKKVALLRRSCPKISITSDVIVGFPGEEEEDFRQTLALMEDIRFDNLFSFQYSPRKGTAAAAMDRTVGEEVKRDRLMILQALQQEHTLEKNRACVGAIEEVLVEGPSPKGGKMTGRTRSNRIVNFPGEAGLVGQTVRLRVVEAHLHSLKGERELQGGSDVH
jgi:tRNA-2-methylthio-N6-dimethylallyladenosine synthase